MRASGRTRLAVAACAVTVAMVGCHSSPAPAPGTLSAAWTAPVPAEWGSVIASTVAGEAVVVKSANGLAALDRHNGSVRWYRPWGGGSTGSPTVTTNPVFVGSDVVTAVVKVSGGVDVRSYELGNGTVRFVQHLGTGAFTAMTAAGLVVADCATASTCTAERLDQRTGTSVWREGLASPAVALSVVTNRMNRGVGPDLDQTIDDYVNPFRVPTSAVVLVWQRNASGWLAVPLDANTGQRLGQWPAVASRVGAILSDQRFIGWDPLEGCGLHLQARNLHDGTTAWAATVGQWSETDPGPGHLPDCKTSFRPAVAGTRLLAMTEDERPAAIDVSTGKVVWTGAQASHLYGMAGDAAVLRSDHNRGDLAAVDITTNHSLWTRHLPGVAVIAVSADHVVYAAASPSVDVLEQVSIIDARTGRTRVAADSNKLLGLGTGWVLTGAAGRSPAVRLYTFS
jgi:hypothetical protein